MTPLKKGLVQVRGLLPDAAVADDILYCPDESLPEAVQPGRLGSFDAVTPMRSAQGQISADIEAG